MSVTMERYLFYGSLATVTSVLFLTNFVIIPVFFQMILYTFPIIYVGAHLSLKQNEIDPITGEMPNKNDSMDHKDAILFPVFGSVALCSLYMAYKFLDPYYVNLLLTSYLTLIGTIASGETFDIALKPVWMVLFRKEHSLNLKFSFWPFGTSANPFTSSTAWHRIFSYICSLCLAVLWTLTKSWICHNLFAISFSIQAIALVAIGSFKVAIILLSGLFVYDIFWVFGTEVMITVAKSFEGPAKLIFPVSFSPWTQSILGLGDIVIPGIFISMCLRFDNYMHELALRRAHKKTDGDELETKKLAFVDIHAKFGKFYFWVVMVSYELGLITTGSVMYIFQHPQPALLYLVPFCVFSLFGAATFNGEVKDVLSFKEDKICSKDAKEDEAQGTEIANEDDKATNKTEETENHASKADWVQLNEIQ